MQRSILTGAAMLLSLATAASAQTVSATPPKPPVDDTKGNVVLAATPPATAAAPADTDTKGSGVRRQLMDSLQKAGFTDVTVAADSFVVQAKDKAGAPVTMFLDADSATVFTGADAAGDATPAPVAAAGATAAPAAGGVFATIATNSDLSSQVIGVEVMNGAKQDIGTIKDIAFSRNGVKAYIVGVGGFLGMGDHYVAVRPSAVTLTFDATEKKWHAAMDANAAQLKAAPEYKYASKL